MNKRFFSLRFALSNLKKNRRLYLPSIFCGCGLCAITAVLMTMVSDEQISQLRGGAYIPTIMQLGVRLMVLLSFILILYINSFLMKQRRHEYGIYHVLGMEKRHIGRILFLENFFCAVLSICGGLFLGAAMYKALSLLLLRILEADTVTGFYYLGYGSFAKAGLLFAALYVFAYVMNRLQIGRMKTVDLLQNRTVGEREPKTKWPVFVIGVATMGAGYYIALSVKTPLASLQYIFLAVVLIMAGTYCLFTAGSIVLLKFLKNKKTYYYKANHMTAVSGLLYRMKQNAVGLASVCILATGVLVMLSTTVSLYAGIGDALDTAYPHDMSVYASYTTTDGTDGGEALLPVLEEYAATTAEKYDLTITDMETWSYLKFPFGYRENGEMLADTTEMSNWSVNENLCMMTVITAAEYERLTGETITLAGNEVGYCELTRKAQVHLPETFCVGDLSFVIAEELESYPVTTRSDQLYHSFGLVVSDENVTDQLEELYDSIPESYGYLSFCKYCELQVDYSDRDDVLAAVSDDLKRELGETISAYVAEADNAADQSYSTNLRIRAEQSAYFYGLYGSLLVLGMFLAVVFLFATALIIYYKQVSEGYEDREHYQIMQKVGMSRAEVRKTITTQILLVFFLSLITAAVHMAVMFPILKKILVVMNLSNDMLFVACALICLLVFAGVYALIYRLTARVYYRIVH